AEATRSVALQFWQILATAFLAASVALRLRLVQLPEQPVVVRHILFQTVVPTLRQLMGQPFQERQERILRRLFLLSFVHRDILPGKLFAILGEAEAIEKV